MSSDTSSTTSADAQGSGASEDEKDAYIQNEGADPRENPVTRGEFDALGALENAKAVLSEAEEPQRRQSLDDDLRSMAQVLRMQKLPDTSSKSCIMFTNLCVRSKGTGYGTQPTIGGILQAPITAARRLLSHRPSHGRTILAGIDGVVREGEMLLVLGRPSNFSSTLLKTLSGQIEDGLNVEGDIKYNGVDVQEFRARFQGDAIYIPDFDLHFPHLLVGDTISFASETKTPNIHVEGETRRHLMRSLTDLYTKLLGLQHTLKTKVGDEYVRGISGGERKRVSLAEALATRASVTIWDSPTHGLDSSNAYEFISMLRAMTTAYRKTTIVALYQAGENLIREFDRVTLLYSGHQIFFGSVGDARAYFQDLGFEYHPQETTADFLTAITDPTARRPKKGWEFRVPRTPEEFVKLWKDSPQYRKLQKEMQQYAEDFSHVNDELERYEAYHSESKSKHQRQRSIYTVDFPTQFTANIKRAFRRFVGDRAYLIATAFSSIFMSLIMGSLFFNVPSSTDGFFSKGGALFFAILYNSLQGMAEITTQFAQRPIIQRQRTYTMYHPLIDALATLLVEYPYKIINITIFDIILYFMVNLKQSASAFFIFWLTTYLSTLVMGAYFRSVAAATNSPEAAFAAAGISVMAFSIYTGYIISIPSMHPWFKWITYINPLSYAFEILVANEFHDTLAPCSILVPSGPGYQNVSSANQVCAVTGARPGEPFVSGDDYIGVSFDYHYSHLWRNMGILCAFLCGFVTIYAITTELKASSFTYSGEHINYRKGQAPDHVQKIIKGGEVANDTEAQSSQEILTEISTHASVPRDLVKSSKAFTWEDMTYDIRLPDGSLRRLLTNVTGYVKPGTLTALMGESGAGKTTLLRVLSERAGAGIVGGRCLVNGLPRGRTFRRMTGYVQQQDVHLVSSTVREALQFSAKLRQPKEVPLSEKLEYVEKVIEMLEMEDFAEAVIGVPGDGLNIEQRKRTTIAVELVAKPELLLFLDEPTSGLDSLSAWSIVRLLRKLADSGQAILCTIHQPSSLIFDQFDRLLLLAKGGTPVYFGEIGHHSQTVLEYFESKSGKKCHQGDNPAEFMLDVIGAGANADSTVDWPEAWRQTDKCRQVTRDLEDMHAQYIDHGTAESDHTGGSGKSFAEPWLVQYKAVQSRLFLHYWRTPQYIMSKFIMNVFVGLFLGFTFYKEDNSVQGLQNKLFAIFMSVIIAMPLMNQFQTQFASMTQLYQEREKPSGLYHWSTYVLSTILAEVSFNMVTGTLFFFPWYFAVGFSRTWTDPGNGTRGLYMWLQLMSFEMWFSTFGIAVNSLAPNAQTAAVLTTVLVSFVVAFNGVLQPLSQLPNFWHFMYRLSPYTYLMGGYVSNALHGTVVVCKPEEINVFQPPSGQTCLEYAGPFTRIGGTILNPDATSDCQYCRFANGDQYLATRNMDFNDHWRNLGIMVAYVAFNTGVAFLFFYLAKVATFDLRRLRFLRRKIRK